MSNLVQRLLVALIGIPIVVFIVLMKPIALLVLLVILGVLAVQEFYGLAKAKGFLTLESTGMALTALIILSFGQLRLSTRFHALDVSRFTTYNIVSVLLILSVIIIFTVEMFRNKPNPFNHIAFTLSGIVYVGLGLGSLYGIHEYFEVRAMNGDLDTMIGAGVFIVTMLAAIWICDSAAYFGGKAMGKHLLFERISPKKTWEGALWGLLFSFLTWFAARAFIPAMYGLRVIDCIVLGLIVGVMGQIGDLAESQLKRDAGVKDSSTLIPGHGGVLDRLDSILFVAPLTFVYVNLFGV